jgi:hypothetical protein
MPIRDAPKAMVMMNEDLLMMGAHSADGSKNVIYSPTDGGSQIQTPMSYGIGDRKLAI